MPIRSDSSEKMSSSLLVSYSGSTAGWRMHTPSVCGGSIMVMFQDSNTSWDGRMTSAHCVVSVGMMSETTMNFMLFMNSNHFSRGPCMAQSGLEWQTIIVSGRNSSPNFFGSRNDSMFRCGGWTPTGK